MPAIDFARYFRNLYDIGVFDVVLPFLLVFVIFYAALQKTKVLGSKKSMDEYNKETDSTKKSVLYSQATGKKFNAVVSLVVALLVVIPHVVYPGTQGKLSLNVAGYPLPDAVAVINNSLPAISVWIVAILMVLLLMGLFGAKMEILGYPLTSLIAIASFLIVVYVFGASANFWDIPAFLRRYNLDSPQNLFALLLIFAFAVILYFIVKEPGTEIKRGAKGELSEGSWSRAVEDLFKSKGK